MEPSDTETAPQKGSSTDKPKGKCNRGSKAKEDQQDWAAWGTEDAWNQGWTDDWDAEGWAWDSAAWWDSQCSTYQLDTQNPDKPEKPSKKKRSKCKAEMTAEKKPEDADTSAKKAKLEKKPKTEKEAEEHDAKDGDMTERPAAKKKRSPGAKADAKSRPAKKSKKETHSTKGSQEKNKKVKSIPDSNQVKGAKSIQDLPLEDHKKVQQMLDFMAGVTDLTEDQARVLVRGRLKDYAPCRFNVYWPRGAVGLHMRAENKDFAYFRPFCPTCPHKYVMAAALKGAEMLASRLTLSVFQILMILDV